MPLNVYINFAYKAIVSVCVQIKRLDELAKQREKKSNFVVKNAFFVHPKKKVDENQKLVRPLESLLISIGMPECSVILWIVPI